MELGFVEALLVSFAGGALSGYASYRVQVTALKREYQLQDSAQRVAHKLLWHPEWTMRSFKVIRHHLGGFDDAALRQILVRTGAIRFKAQNGEEVWGLVERNEAWLGVTQIDQNPANVSDDRLFLN